MNTIVCMLEEKRDLRTYIRRYKKGKMVDMINRELTARERQIYETISDTDDGTFQNIVDIVRRDMNKYRYAVRERS